MSKSKKPVIQSASHHYQYPSESTSYPRIWYTKQFTRKIVKAKVDRIPAIIQYEPAESCHLLFWYATENADRRSGKNVQGGEESYFNVSRHEHEAGHLISQHKFHARDLSSTADTADQETKYNHCSLLTIYMCTSCFFVVNFNIFYNFSGRSL
jgi:hypothetical protein